MQDSGNNIYWQHFSEQNIKQTSQHWKIDIPLKNVLANDKEKILSLSNRTVLKSKIKDNKPTQRVKITNLTEFQVHSYLNEKTNDLHIDVIFKFQKLDFNLSYKPASKNWDASKSFLSWDDPYYYTLSSIVNIVSSECNNVKTLKSLETIILKKIPTIHNGIEAIMEYFFNQENQAVGIPSYQNFIEIFKMHSGLKKNQFKVQAIGHVVHFYAKNKTYEIDTYQGLKAKLNYYVETDSHDEIFIDTDYEIWNEIYEDPGIEKHKFVPILQGKWEVYWNELYSKIKREVGSTNHLDRLKEQSLRELNGFVNLYNETPSIIKLAFDYDEMLLYPLAVFSMLRIYDLDVCLDEYCEYAFESPEWESIWLDDDDDDDSEIFYIKELEY